MEILNFSKFKLFENNDTPEGYIKSALIKIKSKIEKMFDGTVNSDDIETFSDKKAKSDDQNFSDLNLELQSCELSTYSKTTDNVKAIYQDDKYRYDLTVSIDLKEAVPEDEDKKEKFSDTDIKNCNVNFKAYSLDDFQLIGKINKTIKISEIDQDLLIKLKIEIEDEFGNGDQEEFKIETDE